jgi:hypothetical protein
LEEAAAEGGAGAGAGESVKYLVVRVDSSAESR